MISADHNARNTFSAIGFAAGDIANHLHPVFGRVRVEHYNNAEKMGRAASFDRDVPDGDLRIEVLGVGKRQHRTRRLLLLDNDGRGRFGCGGHALNL